jgi:hypothetical protein
MIADVSQKVKRLSDNFARADQAVRPRRDLEPYAAPGIGKKPYIYVAAIDIHIVAQQLRKIAF